MKDYNELIEKLYKAGKWLEQNGDKEIEEVVKDAENAIRTLAFNTDYELLKGYEETACFEAERANALQKRCKELEYVILGLKAKLYDVMTEEKE